MFYHGNAKKKAAFIYVKLVQGQVSCLLELLGMSHFPSVVSVGKCWLVFSVGKHSTTAGGSLLCLLHSQVCPILTMTLPYLWMTFLLALPALQNIALSQSTVACEKYPDWTQHFKKPLIPFLIALSSFLAKNSLVLVLKTHQAKNSLTNCSERSCKMTSCCPIGRPGRSQPVSLTGSSSLARLLVPRFLFLPA